VAFWQIRKELQYYHLPLQRGELDLVSNTSMLQIGRGNLRYVVKQYRLQKGQTKG
jgi:hypothetical protein